MTSSRDRILLALRRASSGREAPHPGASGDWTTYPDVGAAFEASVGAVGGRVVRVRSRDHLPAAVARQPEFAAATRRVSTVPEVVGTVDPSRATRPHELADLEFGLFEGEIGVAENGAVWVDAARFPHRAVVVLAEHVAVVVHSSSLVDHMHAAYARLAGRIGSFGVFLSGPSKTADIEQALVLGAQGARTMTIFLIEPAVEPVVAPAVAPKGSHGAVTGT